MLPTLTRICSQRLWLNPITSQSNYMTHRLISEFINGRLTAQKIRLFFHCEQIFIKENMLSNMDRKFWEIHTVSKLFMDGYSQYIHGCSCCCTLQQFLVQKIDNDTQKFAEEEIDKNSSRNWFSASQNLSFWRSMTRNLQICNNSCSLHLIKGLCSKLGQPKKLPTLISVSSTTQQTQNCN